MEIREFAERVLTSDTLDEKLAGPGPDPVTDVSPGKSQPAPAAPGRTAELRLRSDRQRASFPRVHQLRDAGQRGILLHFFANHELLAAELMALALLRFPDAPAAFRRGLVNTLREEQHHTRLYLNRMTACGVRFGDLPVSGYFWNMVAPMETPLDYVSRLSLTFEQANLDYARHYAEIFRAAGDSATAAVLQKVYRDEIAHVGYGLKWFRRWKSACQTDWEAFEKQLIFPLSPVRAKGNGARFNAEGRLQAGLDPGFVGRLEIFERSRGRTPNVYCFYPDEEAAMASGLDGAGYQTRAEVAMLGRDLEILPAFLARRDDVVLVRAAPSSSHLRKLRACGFELPEFEVMSGDDTLAAGSLTKQRKLDQLRPWGRGPQSARLLAPLLQNRCGSRLDDAQFWSESVRSVYSKAWDVGLLKRLPPEIAAPPVTGRICETMDAVLDSAEDLKRLGFPEIAFKAPFGSAGQKNQRLPSSVAPGDRRLRWAERVLDRQGALIVEPWLKRLADFSVQFQMAADGKLRKRGVTLLDNDSRGQFVSARCGPKICRGMEPLLARFLMDEALPHYEEGGAVARLLETGLRDAGYFGPAGVDALVYQAPGGAGLHLKPIVEVNPRYTMGRVALELMRRVAPGHSVRFEILPTEAWSDRDPPELDESGKLCGGSLALNDAERAHRVVAVLHVGRRQQGLPVSARSTAISSTSGSPSPA